MALGLALSQALDHVGNIGGKRGFEREGDAGNRVQEPQAKGVQSLAIEQARVERVGVDDRTRPRFFLFGFVPQLGSGTLRSRCSLSIDPGLSRSAGWACQRLVRQGRLRFRRPSGW